MIVTIVRVVAHDSKDWASRHDLWYIFNKGPVFHNCRGFYKDSNDRSWQSSGYLQQRVVTIVGVFTKTAVIRIVVAVLDISSNCGWVCHGILSIMVVRNFTITAMIGAVVMVFGSSLLCGISAPCLFQSFCPAASKQ